MQWLLWISLALSAYAQYNVPAGCPSPVTVTSLATTTVTVARAPIPNSSTLSTVVSSRSSIVAVSSPVLSSSTVSSNTGPTNKAYIDTVMRHHNRHRQNHTASAMTWNSTLGETAKKIAQRCVYQHDVATDCNANGASCYGQNIAAGFPPNQMGAMISEGFYNSEVNKYTYYGSEPDLNTFGGWGHFSQIVWKIGTTSVACYTADCSATGLTFPNGGGAGVLPYFTVCNYGAAGNIVADFTNNVIKPINLPSIYGDYGCPNQYNCEG